jgi:hypothetical protein
MFAPFEFRAALLKDYPVVLFATLSGLIGSLVREHVKSSFPLY